MLSDDGDAYQQMDVVHAYGEIYCEVHTNPQLEKWEEVRSHSGSFELRHHLWDWLRAYLKTFDAEVGKAAVEVVGTSDDVFVIAFDSWDFDAVIWYAANLYPGNHLMGLVEDWEKRIHARVKEGYLQDSMRRTAGDNATA